MAYLSFRAVWLALSVPLIAVWTTSAFAAEPSHGEERPNVVVIMMDDLGATDLGCAGSRFYKTPHIDRLAGQSMRFDQAYASCPVCSPTRAALFTGKTPARLHLTDFIPGEIDPKKHRMLRPEFHQQLPLEETTLAELLAEAGYVTAAIGKWHLGGEGFEPQRQGFQIAMGGFERGSVNHHFAPYLIAGRQLPGLENPPAGENITERLTLEAEKFLEGHVEKQADRPFFLYLSHYAVHTPIEARPEVVAKYEDSAKKQKGWQRNPVFAAMVEAMDDSVGRVMAKLDELKLTDNTLVIFTSDNGGLATSGQPTKLAATNNAPFREGKGYLYEGGIRVPLFFRWPGQVQADSTCDMPTSTIDLMPTICAACQITLPSAVAEQIEGVSLLTQLHGAKENTRPALYWHYPHYSPQGGHAGGAIREGDYKLIEYFDSGRRELYDLANDVRESRNLIDVEGERAEELAQKLAAWRKRVDAQMPTDNPDFVPDEQQADGSITLPAETAIVHGVMLRYEPVPHKDTLGYWSRAEDWASWEFVVTQPGEFRVEILQGCGPGSGGSEVELSVADQSVRTTVEETGGFQDFKRREIGKITIAKPGRYTLNVQPKTKPGQAVMDLREVRLVPAASQ